jgi:hypothetical protein
MTKAAIRESNSLRRLIIGLLVSAFAGGMCLDALYPPFARYMSAHQVLSGLGLQVLFLAAAYLVFDSVVERREQKRWRRVAEAAVADLVLSADLILDEIAAVVRPVSSTGPYVGGADWAEVLRDVLTSQSETVTGRDVTEDSGWRSLWRSLRHTWLTPFEDENTYADLVAGWADEMAVNVRAASNELRRAFRTWAPALAGTSSLDPVLSVVPDLVSTGIRIAAAMENNAAYGSGRSRGGFIDECVIAYEQYAKGHAVLSEAAISAGFAPGVGPNPAAGMNRGRRRDDRPS